MLNLKSTEIAGCFLFESALISDRRGYFRKTYSQSRCDGIESWLTKSEVREVFWSESSRGVARGLHFQLPPFAVDKFVVCVSGQITDYVVDLRADQPTFGRCLQFELGGSPTAYSAIEIPSGCAHGFVTNSESALVMYLQSGVYSSDADSGISISKYLREDHLGATMSERDSGFSNIESVPLLITSVWINQ